LFISTQQVQPSLSRQLQQSQQAWIISQHLASPLVQVMQTPSLVISHLHMPIVRLQQQHIMPLHMQQQLHMEPVIMLHRFCIMEHVAASLLLHTIFIPPWHFSIFMVQRGTMSMLAMLGMPGICPGMPPIPGMAGMPMLVRSIITALVIGSTPSLPGDWPAVATNSLGDAQACQSGSSVQWYSRGGGRCNDIVQFSGLLGTSRPASDGLAAT
jgi:hypothetical protein